MRLLPALLLLFLLTLTGCESQQQFTGGCTENSMCPVGSVCRVNPTGGGICICRSDEACGEGEFCNSQGACQRRAGCRTNAECEASRFCDTGTGRCLERTRCGADVHCLPGTICDAGSGSCVDGCRDHGDCPLYSACENGRCLAGRCADNAFCAWGDLCANGSCISHPNQDHCRPCDRNAPCPNNNDFCLINNFYEAGRPETGSPNFCGVECTSHEQCPSGYNCGGVVLLTQDQCTRNADCGGGGRRCVIGEGANRGFCTCVADEECAFDELPALCAGSCAGLGVIPCLSDTDCTTRCDLTRRTCQNPQGRACTSDAECAPMPLCGNYAGSGRNVCINSPNAGAPTPCTLNSDCLCMGGRCANSGRPCTNGAQCNPPCRGGGCALGSACAPFEGLSCQDVR